MFTPGILSREDADALNALKTEVVSLRNMVGVPPLDISHSGDSTVFSIIDNGGFFAKITSGGNPYAFQELDYLSAGMLTGKVSGRFGSVTANPAYELTGLTTVATGSVVRMYPTYFDASTMQNYGFILGGPSTSGSVSGSVTVYSPSCSGSTLTVLSGTITGNFNFSGYS